MRYPAPEENPICECGKNRQRAFWCKHGHVLECHFPYTCREAGCSHHVEFHRSPAEAARLEFQAREALASGRLAPYYLDEKGQVCVRVPKDTQSKAPQSTPNGTQAPR